MGRAEKTQDKKVTGPRGAIQGTKKYLCLSRASARVEAHAKGDKSEVAVEVCRRQCMPTGSSKKSRAIFRAIGKGRDLQSPMAILDLAEEGNHWAQMPRWVVLAGATVCGAVSGTVLAVGAAIKTGR